MAGNKLASGCGHYQGHCAFNSKGTWMVWIQQWWEGIIRWDGFRALLHTSVAAVKAMQDLCCIGYQNNMVD